MKKILFITCLFAACAAPESPPTICECFQASRKGYDSEVMRKQCNKLATETPKEEMRRAMGRCINHGVRSVGKKEVRRTPSE